MIWNKLASRKLHFLTDESSRVLQKAHGKWIQTQAYFGTKFHSEIHA